MSSVTAAAAVRLWKTFRSKPNTIPVDNRNSSPSHRNGVRLQTGMLLGITPEWCSLSDWNPFAFDRIPHSIPKALYWDTEDPFHYVRLQRVDERAKANDLLINGGEDTRLAKMHALSSGGAELAR